MLLGVSIVEGSGMLSEATDGEEARLKSAGEERAGILNYRRDKKTALIEGPIPI